MKTGCVWLFGLCFAISPRLAAGHERQPGTAGNTGSGTAELAQQAAALPGLTRGPECVTRNRLQQLRGPCGSPVTAGRPARAASARVRAASSSATARVCRRTRPTGELHERLRQRPTAAHHLQSIADGPCAAPLLRTEPDCTNNACVASAVPAEPRRRRQHQRGRPGRPAPRARAAGGGSTAGTAAALPAQRRRAVARRAGRRHRRHRRPGAGRPKLITSSPSGYWNTTGAITTAAAGTATMTVNDGHGDEDFEASAARFNEMGGATSRC
jgi:hypothetical protein